MTRSFRSAIAALGCGLMAACGGTDAPAATGSAMQAPAAEAPAPAAVPTGNVVEVRMLSGAGERFEPSTLTVRRGDVVRFVLESGVHNVSFPANKNPGGITLPAPSPYLTSPGQTHDVAIDLPAGTYTYQCDPHVMMGMVGTITVTD